ncbi:MAG: anti-sigma-factor antagonist [uncultured bacterium]|nr:MAG: anti-sigma-factor antagonist [uncultured bacterium]
MTVQIIKENNTVRLIIEGEIKESLASEMKEKFNQLSLPAINEVIFDFKGVTHIGSAGIGKLLLFYKTVTVNDKKIRIENVSPAINDLFKLLKLDSLFTITAR